MASNTPNLNLLKKDPVVDGADTFNIQTMLNDNWDKIDQAVGEVREELQDIDIPLASLTKPGIVQISNSTNGTREDVAATEKAVKATFDTATAAQTTANAANLAAAAAQAKADAAETPSGAQAKVNAAVGSLPSLLTTAKGNTVAAINELFTSASNGKNAVAAAITGKGVPASGSDTFAQLAGKIGQIVTGKKFATGVDIKDYIPSGYELIVNGLNFNPSLVFVTYVWTYQNPNYSQYMEILVSPNLSQTVSQVTGVWVYFTFSDVATFKSDFGTITPGGFRVKAPFSGGGSAPYHVKWYAYE